MITDPLLPHEVEREKPYLTISHNKTKQLLPFNTIIRLEACGVYTIVFLLNGQQPVYTRNIGKVYDELNQEMFFRVHKSHIINLWQVKSCMLKKRCGHILMVDNQLIKLSYRNRSDFTDKYEKFCMKNSIQRVG